MFRQNVIWYEVVEGNHVNDYDNAGDFTSMRKAVAYAKKTRHPYARVDKYAGIRLEDGGYDGDYVDTVYERHLTKG